MKTFTLKDFISYNNPCFNCGKVSYIKATNFVSNNPITKNNYFNLSTVIDKVNTIITLSIKYNKTLKLIINNTTNEFSVSNLDSFGEFINDNEIFLTIYCKNGCFSRIESSYLQFNFDKQFVLPMSISHEMFSIRDSINYYYIESSFINNETIIKADDLDLEEDQMFGAAPRFKIKIPLLPLYKFKTRDNLLYKIKTYITFS